MGVSKPTATGQLEGTPFCELLVFALDRRLSGTLVLEAPDQRKHAVLFWGGHTVKVRVSANETKLGEVLVARGDVDAAARRAAAAGPEAQLFGQRLLQSGALTEPQLDLALKDQLARQIAWLSRLPVETAFGYYENVDFLANWGGERLEVDPLSIIWTAIFAQAPAERVAAVCRSMAGKTLRLHPFARVARFDLPSRERAVLDVLRARPQSLSDLARTGLAGEETLSRLVYALVLTRHLDVGSQPLGVQPGRHLVASRKSMLAVGRSQSSPAASRGTPVAASGGGSVSAGRAVAVATAIDSEPQPSSATESSAESSKRRRRSEVPTVANGLTEATIEARLLAIEQASHYEVMGLPANADAAAVPAAFSALAKRWHPDRLAADQQHLRERLTRIFARMTEANAVLSHPESREQYDQSLIAELQANEEQEQVARVLRAAEAFQKAEILVKKRDLRGAEQLARMAFEGDADQPEYVALHAWIRSRRPDCDEAELGGLRKTLKDALARQPDNVKIRYYYACVLKAAGDEKLAIREFRRVAEDDPNNLDAVRALRLHDMRRRNSMPTQTGASGLFGRIFKR